MAGWDIQQSSVQAGLSIKPKVMILIPHGNEKDYREWRDWFHFGMQKPEGTGWLEMRGLTLTTCRTALVLEALKAGATHVFFLDDDTICPNNIIPAFLSYNLPIICGLYMAKKKKAERGLTAFMRVQTQEGKTGYMPIGYEQTEQFVAVDVTGLGCALIKREIFERTSQPWFQWDVGGESEDFFFFSKVARELNIKPICDRFMECEHIGLFKMNCKGEFETLGV